MMARSWWVFCGLLSVGIILEAAGKGSSANLGEPSLNEETIATLRARGPEGLAQALRVHDELKKRYARVQQTILDLDKAIHEPSAAATIHSKPVANPGDRLDVLPGLYSPKDFLAWLRQMDSFHGEYVATAEAERPSRLADFHRQRRETVFKNWTRDVRQAGEDNIALVSTRIDEAIVRAHKRNDNSPIAVAASQMAVIKTAGEEPLLRFANFSGPWIEHAMDDDLWQAVANLHRSHVKLDEESIALMRQEFPRAAVAGQVSVSKMRQEDPLLRTVRLFESSMALDTVRNEYLPHRRERSAVGRIGARGRPGTRPLSPPGPTTRRALGNRRDARRRHDRDAGAASVKSTLPCPRLCGSGIFLFLRRRNV